MGELFEEFTHVLLLGEGGKTVYWGRSELLTPYLGSLGFKNTKGENPADFMIDVCSGLEVCIDPTTGQEDKNFACPGDLFALWEEKQKPNVFAKDFEWTKGDMAPSEIASLQRLEKRTGASLGQSMYYLTERAFRQIQKAGFFCHLIVCAVVGLQSVISIILSSDRTVEAGDVAGYSAPNTLYFLVIVVQARGDYGGKMLETMRELNAGMSLFGTWFGIFVRSLATGFCKAITFCILTYALNTPMQGFGIYFVSYLLATYCWIFFSHWMTVWFSNPVTVILILVLVVMIQPLQDGTACFIQGPDEGMLCPGAQPVLPFFLPPYFGSYATAGFYQFLMLNGAELKALPAQFAIDPTVNGTNYYRMVSAGLDKWNFVSTKFTGPTFDGMMLVVLIALHNAFLYFLLHRARAWVRAATAAKSSAQDQARARFMNDSLNKCGSFCGMGALIERVFRLKPPEDIQEMVARKSARATSSRVSPPTTSSRRL